MADYYVFNNHLFSTRPKVFTKPEFIKSLSNYEERYLLDDLGYLIPGTFRVYHNVKNAKLVHHAMGWYSFECECTSYHTLNKEELANLVAQSKSWLSSQKETYPGYLNAMIQGNGLATPVNLPIEYLQPVVIKKPAPVVAHTSRGNFGHGRVGHPQHVFASDNQQAKLDRQRLQMIYRSAKIGHLHRRYKKNHPYAFPVFDDDEYIQGRHSTGWKYSTKNRKSWGSPDKKLNKRAMSHLYNDYSAKDDFEDHGGDYYYPSWWVNLPDENQVSMHDYQQTIKDTLSEGELFWYNNKPATYQ